MSAKKRSFSLLFLAIIALAAFALYWIGRNNESTDAATFESNVVPIAAKVGGYVAHLDVGDNQAVKKGDILLSIDDRDYLIARDRAKAALDSALAKLDAAAHNYSSASITAPSSLESANAQVGAAAAEWKRARLELDRLQKLTDTVRSRQALENGIAAEDKAKSNLSDAQARLKSAQTAPSTIAAAQASVNNLQAEVDIARANLAQAEKDLADTKIIAPMDGHITRKNAEIGAYVTPGQQLLSLVGNDIWVIANFKETQLTRMKPGQAVDIAVDAYPDVTLHGKIDSVQSGSGARFSLFPPENATGNFVKIVQRVPVKITLDKQPDESLHLGPGMSVEPTVYLK